MKMDEYSLYCVRMRASKGSPHELGGTHVSGAERIIRADKILEVANLMMVRAMTHENGPPGFVNINIELLSKSIGTIKKTSALPVTTVNIENQEDARDFLLKLLELIGVSAEAANKATPLLTKGTAPDGGNMRGAVIMDVITGERLEPDQYRGVRVSRMDMVEEAEEEFNEKLREQNLDHNNVRIREALVLATKVVRAKGTVAELSWSDDPGYTTGYVASEKLGYVRIPHIKPKGSEKGGRIFFVENINVEEYIKELEEQPMLVTRITEVNPTVNRDEYLRSIINH